MKKICIIGYYPYLTLGKEYEIIKTVHDSYVIERDDGSIDKMGKSRFGTKEEYETLQSNFQELKQKMTDRWKS